MKVNEKGFDPKLKEAMEEIKTTLKKYDCLGSVIIVSPTHSEYIYHLEASWSVMKFESVERLRFRSKKEDFKNKEDQDFATRSSVHALTTFLQFGARTGVAMKSIVETLRKHMTILYETWED